MKKLFFGLALCATGSAFGMQETSEEKPKWWTQEASEQAIASNIKALQSQSKQSLIALRAHIDGIEKSVEQFPNHADAQSLAAIERAASALDGLEKSATKISKRIDLIVKDRGNI